jgi:adenylate cyclase
MASPVQDQPSIAVLPFANMSDDPGQDYLSAGMTEDLTTRLSKLPGMAVTARHSASRYQGKDLDPNRVGADLGVKYLLAGSVRRDGQRLRVTARLVEAGTTRQLWADTYDADLSSLFGIYDEVTRAIVLRLEARLTRAELEQSLRRAPNSLTAYDFVLRGNARLAQIHSGDRGDTLFAARQHFEQALTIDPRSAPATHGIALTYLMAYQEPTSHPAIGGEYRQQASVERALALARQAVALDEELAEARMTLARILFWRNERAESLAEYERAFALNPNLVEPRYALVLIHEGRIDEALAYLNHAMRLDPFYPPYTSFVVGKAHAVAGREEEALRWLRVSTGRMKDYRPGLVWRAASAAGMGLAEEARRHAAEILRLEPSFTVTRFVQDLALKDERQAAHARDRLIKAGLPE